MIILPKSGLKDFMQTTVNLHSFLGVSGETLV